MILKSYADFTWCGVTHGQQSVRSGVKKGLQYVHRIQYECMIKSYSYCLELENHNEFDYKTA